MKRSLLGCAITLAIAGCSPSPLTSSGPLAPSTPATGSASRPDAAREAAFAGSVSAIDAPTRERMRFSWRPGCPVALDELRVLRISHRTFAGGVREGEMVVHRDSADRVVGVFKRLFDAEFPIERMELVDVYEGDDRRSMEANNTSGFNCRRTTGDPGRWSEHAFGRAIDVNPVQNPYVARGVVEPRKGSSYVDRREAPGVILPGSVVVNAFAAIGWSWGGAWRSAKDYQHFSATGR